MDDTVGKDVALLQRMGVLEQPAPEDEALRMYGDVLKLLNARLDRGNGVRGRDLQRKGLGRHHLDEYLHQTNRQQKQKHKRKRSELISKNRLRLFHLQARGR